MKDKKRILEEYAKAYEEEKAAEMDSLLAGDEEALAAIEKYGKRKYRKPLRHSKGFRRAVAAMVGLAFAAGIAIPSMQASAWRIWPLDLIFGNQGEYTEARPEEDFAIYYIDNLPEGFELENERITKGVKIVNTYSDENNNYITLTQAPKNIFETYIDYDGRLNRNETIGDFDVFISEGEEEIIFLITTDKEVIMVRTDAGFEVGIEFIKNLKEI